MGFINNGWNYISAIFMTMLEQTKADEIIEPQYIYRGIAKNYVSRSETIEKYLLDKNITTENTNEDDIRKKSIKFYEEDIYPKMRVVWNNLENVIKRYVDNDKYLEKYRNYLKQGINTSFISLVEFINCPYYELMCPEYIKSGLAVRLQEGSVSNTPHIDYINYIIHMLNDVKERFPRYVDENYTDLEILADLQHKGAASCLVDFSNNFLMSLYFATNTDFEDFGYLFCYDINKAIIGDKRLTILDPQRYDKKSIIELLSETAKAPRYSGKQEYKFWLWRPSNLNERIARQDSIFIFGLEKFRVSEHKIITIPIPPNWKRDIQQTLKAFFGITTESVYCDVDGYADANSKKSPYEKTVVRFFNEKFDAKEKEFENKSDKIEALRNLQNGMSCLFQCEYELALKYFTQCETKMGQIPHDLKEIKGEDKEDIFFKLKDITIGLEINYSKAICLKHLKDPYGAIKEFENVFNSYKLIEKIEEKIIKNNKEWYNLKQNEWIDEEKENHFMKYKKYFEGKYQKAINDMTDLYYDTNQYKKIIDNLEKIKIEGKDSVIENIKALKQTIINEVKCLIFLDNYLKKKNNNNDTITINEKEFKGQPFYYALNKYFLSIKEIIEIEKSEFDNIYKKLEDDINNIINAGFPREFYSSWDLGDIKKKIRSIRSKDEKKYIQLMMTTSKIEDFMNFVQGKIKIEPW